MAPKLARRGRGRHDGSVARSNDVEGSAHGSPAVSASEFLELLGDEHTRDVLHAVAERPRSGSEVAEAVSVSKPTAYRRLNRLEEAGFVTTHTKLDPNGNHHKRYSAVFEGATLQLEDDLSVAVEVGRTDPSPMTDRRDRPHPTERR